MPAAAESKFITKNAPSWTKIHASSKRLTSRMRFSNIDIVSSTGIARRLTVTTREERVAQ
jgi:hypothetical protein